MRVDSPCSKLKIELSYGKELMGARNTYPYFNNFWAYCSYFVNTIFLVVKVAHQIGEG